ncbi:MAG: DEAD/DEAH box helicase, partial [Acidimicrobiales bacterium]
MDVFELRDQLVADYSSYVRSFISIRDERLRDTVEAELEAGLLWPEPRIGLNPAFAPGGRVEECCERGLLHPACADIFRIKPAEGPGKELRLHRHQAEALEVAATGANYVLTTGTGSGKSLAYLIPIVDAVLRDGPGQGIRAIVVYPMNALANSQAGELEKFLNRGYPPGHPPVTFARYTGQDDEQRRHEIVANPPDILLTNYVMLELILTRLDEQALVKAASNLRFLVFDELHTYRGRQGADVALLARRARLACGGPRLQMVGTSATMASGGSAEAQRAEVARVATLMFGAPVGPEQVINETLRRATTPVDHTDSASIAVLAERVANADWHPPTDPVAFVADPLSGWVESAFGVSEEPGTGRL